MGSDRGADRATGLLDSPAVAITVALMALAYAAAFSVSSALSFRNFGMSAFDVGIHAQAIWKLSTGRGLFNTVRGLPIWGDHCWFFMVFYAPIYKLIPRVETLLVLQSMALASGALPLAALVLRASRSRLAALAFAAAWLLAPALQNMNLENFHPEIFAAPLLLWAVERALAGRWPTYGVAVGLALLCKEDVALTTFVLGLWVARRNRRAGLLTLAGSALWFGLCMKLILPSFNEQGFFRTQGGYWFSELWQRRFEPGFYWEKLVSGRAALYAWKLASPTLFLFLLSPLLAAAALPGFLVNVLSGNDYLASIDYHYNFQTLPLLYSAAGLGYGWLARRAGHGNPLVSRAVLIALVLAAAWANDRWSHMPLRSTATRIAGQYRFFRESGVEQRFATIAAQLPADPDVPISVSHNLLPHLANRAEVYMFPNPFRPVYWGIDGEGLPDPDRIAALLLDTGSADRAILDRLIGTGEFRVAARAGPLLLVHRAPPGPRPPAIGEVGSVEGSVDSIRVLAFLSEEPVESLTPLAGRAPDIEVRTSRLLLPATFGRLATDEGLDLGAADNLRLVLAGSWQAAGARDVVFRVQADDGCRLSLDGRLILDHSGVHSFSEQAASEPIRLSPGSHSLVVDYFEWGGHAGLRVDWAPVGGEFSPLESGQELP